MRLQDSICRATDDRNGGLALVIRSPQRGSEQHHSGFVPPERLRHKQSANLRYVLRCILPPQPTTVDSETGQTRRTEQAPRAKALGPVRVREDRIAAVSRSPERGRSGVDRAPHEPSPLTPDQNARRSWLLMGRSRSPRMSARSARSPDSSSRWLSSPYEDDLGDRSPAAADVVEVLHAGRSAHGKGRVDDGHVTPPVLFLLWWLRRAAAD
jgi:hypothetical protein